MLTEARFTSFKTLRDVCIPLQPFTVLIGPNGVGKSSALDGIHYLLQLPSQSEGRREFRCGPLDVFFVNDRSPTYLLSHDSDGHWGLEVRGHSHRFGFTARCERQALLDEKFEWEMMSASIEMEENGNLQCQHFPRASGDNPLLLLNKPFPKRLTNVVRLRLDADQIKKPSPAAQGKPRMQYDGGELPTLLNHIIGRRDGSIEKIEESMGKLVRGFRRIYAEESQIERFEPRITTVDDQTITRRERVLQSGFTLSVDIGGGRIPAAQLSEGTLLLLAILALVHSQTRPRLILLDDIDRALHPQAQVDLVHLLRNLCGVENELQIIATAHSIMTVAECRKEEVVELHFDEHNHTRAKIIDDSPLLMTPSEIVARYFDIHRTGASELLQRYALIANDPSRDEATDRQVIILRGELKKLGIDPGWEPVPRILKSP